MSRDDEARHRLFLALWPDDATRARLAQAARQWSRHPVPDANLHMTLHFLGACTAAEQECYINVISGISFEGFEIIMDCIGGKSRSGIRWLSASRLPEALARLVANLGNALETCGYQPEQRRFLPHVTISRKEKRPRTRTELPALHWQVREFALVESLAVPGGVRYEVRARRGCSG
ncbi:MAG: RNA 2',3'-cyclic phosphodiesterase [Gammaproteobacteria bacterium]